MRNMRLVIVVLCACIVGCGDEPSRVRVVDRIEADGTYFTKDVQLTSLESLTQLRGGPSEVLAGAKIDFSPLIRFEDGGRSRDGMIQNARPVRASWISSGGTAIAKDYDSLAMFSAYAHLERAAAYFQNLGVQSATDRVPLYYNPAVAEHLEDVGLPATDNAAYLRPADAIILLPMRFLQDIPFTMNPGVLSHEYTHRVWYYEVWNGEFFGLLYDGVDVDDDTAVGTLNLTGALEEGVADYFGAVLASDPQFLDHSLPSRISAERDLENIGLVDSAWINGGAPTLDGQYDPYQLGSVVAATLWAFAQISGSDAVSLAVLSSGNTMGDNLRDNFNYLIGSFEVGVIEQLPPADRAALCDVFTTAYAPVRGRFAGTCP